MLRVTGHNGGWAAGEFLYLGSSKTVTGARFARLDTAVYAPPRVLLAAAGALAARLP